MAEVFFVGAYWGPRVESSTTCAARLEACLKGLGASHEVLSRWYRKGKSRSAAAGQPIDVDMGVLESMLSGGHSRTDVGGEVIEELGFSVALWNNNPVAVSFSTLCGATPNTTSIMNHFVLTLPASSGSSAELYNAEVAKRILMSMVEAWQPQWATFTSHALRARQNTAVARPVVGWQTFVAAKPPSPPPPPDLHVEEVVGGVLITTGPDPQHIDDAQFSSAIEYLSASEA